LPYPSKRVKALWSRFRPLGMLSPEFLCELIREPVHRDKAAINEAKSQIYAAWVACLPRGDVTSFLLAGPVYESTLEALPFA
jgi:hypothetical protein